MTPFPPARLFRLALAALLAAVVSLPFGQRTGRAAAPAGPQYTQDGRLIRPEDYRSWVFLTSGLDMNYSAAPMTMAMQSSFDNVFAAPAAYDAFMATGAWPDHTVIAKEARLAEQKGSINRQGHFQSGPAVALEIHVRDLARFKDSGGWGFFAFDSGAPAQLIPAAASCYSCHAQHAAVDTIFVQFYPTLLPIAEAKGTLSEVYRKELR